MNPAVGLSSGYSDLDAYQRQAKHTDVLPRKAGGTLAEDLLLPMLGLAGEVGGLAADIKKRRRDHLGEEGLRDDIKEELGDMLWYLAVIADRARLDLSEIAQVNLAKAADIFGGQESLPPVPYDEGRPEEQRLPRHLRVHFREHVEQRAGVDVTVVSIRLLDENGTPLGDPLDDNSGQPDEYRFHDVFHLAHMAYLGWSPVVRGLFEPKRKRRGDAVEWIEDGGRAMVVEEGLTAAVFAEAARHHWFLDADRVPTDLLKLCRRMTSHLEVRDRTPGDWQRAILAGYRVFRELCEHRGGVVIVDQVARRLAFEPGSG